MYPYHNVRKGLTFIETLVTVALFTLIMTAIVDSVLMFYRANASSLEQAYQIESARKGVDLLVRDIREASYGENGAYPIAAMSSSSITFFADTDRDSAVEKIHYELVEGSFLKNVTEPSGDPPSYTGGGATSTVSRYVRNAYENTSVFQFYNASSTEIVNLADIVSVISVKVNLVVNVNPTRAPGEFTLRSGATIRNLRAQ